MVGVLIIHICHRGVGNRACESRLGGIRGLPQDRVRYHICWGSWHGPHTTDIALRDIVDPYSVEQRQRGRVRRYIAVLTQRKHTTVYQL
jgi:hypothetical protein